MRYRRRDREETAGTVFMSDAAFDDMLDEWDSICRGHSVDLDGWQRAVETTVPEECRRRRFVATRASAAV